YQAQKTMTIKFRKLDKFDELMSGLYKNGVNQVNGINFQTSQLEKHREQARKLAVQAAKQKAQLLTTELGAKLGRVYNITEAGAPGYPQPMYKANRMMAEAAAYDAGGPTISGGEITITEVVEVSFVIE
ncbi:MAG: SIMPL domain-containing protein, partial [Hymenobacteraceae bacterium]|nr:SIMPL domain-containing protein [Hymenobacteraceae bacterium]